MASLRIQGNQKKVPEGLADHKPAIPNKVSLQGTRPLMRAPSIHQNSSRIPEVKPKTNGLAPRPVAGSSKLPTLSGLRENIPQAKRQRILQDVVRTAGKENGLLQFRERPAEVEDIYADDINSESIVVAYVEHIYTYLHEREAKRISANYMEGMSITPRMRAVLVDWIVSVMHKFKLCQDTLYLSVDLVDRFLSIPQLDVTKDQLQLIGVTAMFIASKFEEVYPPELEDFVFVADSSCEKTEIVEMEMVMANALNFEFTRPAATHFLRRCCKAAGGTSDEYCASKYITELSLLSLELVELRPSLVAAAAVYLTMILRRGKSETVWGPEMEYYTRYTESTVKPIAGKLLKLVIDAPTSRQQCIYKKYTSTKNYEVSCLSGDIALAATKYFAA